MSLSYGSISNIGKRAGFLSMGYFNSNEIRNSVFEKLAKRELTYLSKRDHPNEYRPNCVLVFDEPDLPFILDLHGFTKKAAEDVISDFLDIMIEAGIPKTQIIHGSSGVVLREVCLERLDWYELDYSTLPVAHINVELNGDSKLWRPLEGDLRPKFPKPIKELRFKSYPMIFYAVYEWHTDLAALLLNHHQNKQKQTNPNDAEEYLFLAYWAAIYNGNYGIVNSCLDFGSNPNGRDKTRKTPLIYAVENDALEVARLLLEKGADINAVDSNGKDALTYAYENSKEELVSLLVEYGADTTPVIHKKTKEKKTDPGPGSSKEKNERRKDKERKRQSQKRAPEINFIDKLIILDAFRILEIEPTSIIAIIKSSFVKLAKKAHPDTAPSATTFRQNELKEEFQRLTEARDIASCAAENRLIGGLSFTTNEYLCIYSAFEYLEIAPTWNQNIIKKAYESALDVYERNVKGKIAYQDMSEIKQQIESAYQICLLASGQENIIKKVKNAKKKEPDFDREKHYEEYYKTDSYTSKSKDAKSGFVDNEFGEDYDRKIEDEWDLYVNEADAYFNILKFSSGIITASITAIIGSIGSSLLISSLIFIFNLTLLIIVAIVGICIAAFATIPCLGWIALIIVAIVGIAIIISIIRGSIEPYKDLEKAMIQSLVKTTYPLRALYGQWIIVNIIDIGLITYLAIITVSEYTEDPPVVMISLLSLIFIKWLILNIWELIFIDANKTMMASVQNKLVELRNTVNSYLVPVETSTIFDRNISYRGYGKKGTNRFLSWVSRIFNWPKKYRKVAIILASIVVFIVSISIVAEKTDWFGFSSTKTDTEVYEKPKDYRSGIVSIGWGLPLRTKPDKNAPKVPGRNYLKEGERVELLEVCENEWGKVRTSDGYVGYSRIVLWEEETIDFENESYSSRNKEMSKPKTTTPEKSTYEEKTERRDKPTEKICPECGNEASINAKYCGKCGHAY